MILVEKGKARSETVVREEAPQSAQLAARASNVTSSWRPA